MNPTNQEQILERRAKLVRDRLLGVVDELDRKRHNLTAPVHIGKNLEVPKPVFAGVIAGVGLLAFGALVFALSRIQPKKQVPKHVKVRLERPFWDEIGRNAAKALLSFALIQGGKVAMSRAGKKLSH